MATYVTRPAVVAFFHHHKNGLAYQPVFALIELLVRDACLYCFELPSQSLLI